MNRNPYQFNPSCSCPWCSNAGKPPAGYWTASMFGGRVYCPIDGYGDEHIPPRTLRFDPAPSATTPEVR